MKKWIHFLLVATFCSGLVAPSFAFELTELGRNITINDANPNISTWIEDGETEPGMVNSQIWDLEGFFFNQSNSLSMIGGFNFVAGQGDYDSGDIFISTGTPVYGGSGSSSGLAGNTLVTNTYGYDYVLDLGFTNGLLDGSYTVYRIDGQATVLTAAYLQNEGSSPWRYIDGGDMVTEGSFLSWSGLTNAETGFLGGSHYALTGFDLSFLGHTTDFYAHFTMGCGNDNLMGQGTVVPEPSTFLLFGVGGGLLWLTRRRKAIK